MPGLPMYPASLIARKSRLLGVHLNDSYGKRDDGLVAGSVHPIQTLELLHVLEGLGYRTLWLNEATGRDPFVMAGLLLSATSTLTVALGIANVYARDAVTTAAAQKTLAEAYPDRFLLGLGVSSPVLVAWPVTGSRFVPVR